MVLAQPPLSTLQFVENGKIEGGSDKRVNAYPSLTTSNALEAHHTVAPQSIRRHRMSVEYVAWRAMLARCYNQSHKSYKHWGGRGITVCARWLDSFQNFLEDMGRRPSTKASLGRIDNESGYSKDNCRWESWAEQQNNRRSNHLLTLDGVTRNISEWAKHTGIPRDTLQARLKMRWSLRRLLTAPARETNVLTFNGRTQTHGQWAREMRLNRHVLNGRLLRGWSIKAALTTPHIPIVTATFNGETKRLSEWGKQFSINRQTLRCRLERGWSMEQALTEPAGETIPHAKKR